MPKDYSERDLRDEEFVGRDIRGWDFKNSNLTGVDLSGAKINGTNFCGANLTGAKLDKAVCGLKTYWAVCVVIMSLLIGSLSGFSASILLSCNYYFFSGSRRNRNFINFCIATIYITVLHPFIFYIFKKSNWLNVHNLVLFATLIIIIVGVVIPLVVLINKPKTKTNLTHLSMIVISILIIVINGYLTLRIDTLEIDSTSGINKTNLEILQRFIGAALGAFLGTWISRIAIIDKDKKFVWIWELFVNFASIQGTKFDYSKLNNACFKEVNLRGSYFLNNELTRTNWEKVKQIDCSTIQENYLENLKIQDLVIKQKLIKDKNYQDMTLKELNLDNTILDEIDLSGADLSNSTLKSADLTNSNLSQTRLDNVDLSEANITGAIIEPKSIPSTAILYGLKCDYFYPKSNSKERYPITGKLTSYEAIKLLQESSKFILIFEQ